MHDCKSRLTKSLQRTSGRNKSALTRQLNGSRLCWRRPAAKALLCVLMLTGCASSPQLLPVVQREAVKPPASVTVETSQRLREWSNEVQQLLKEARILLEKLLQDSKAASP